VARPDLRPCFLSTKAVYVPTSRDPQVTKVLCPFFVQEADGLRPARKTTASCRDHLKMRPQAGIDSKQCGWSERCRSAQNGGKPRSRERRYFVPCDWLRSKSRSRCKEVARCLKPAPIERLGLIGNVPMFWNAVVRSLAAEETSAALIGQGLARRPGACFGRPRARLCGTYDGSCGRVAQRRRTYLASSYPTPPPTQEAE
jgi:hypothetical protein